MSVPKTHRHFVYRHIDALHMALLLSQGLNCTSVCVYLTQCSQVVQCGIGRELAQCYLVCMLS